MAAAQETVVLRQRVCLGPQCRTVFFICASCDRGHRYCSLDCREQARRQQRRRANERHQRSPEGRLDHRDRQREYRRRCQPVLTRVTDQASPSITFPASSQCGRGSLRENVPRHQMGLGGQLSLQLKCQICGRGGRFIDPFPRIPRRR
jgi:hypothetical protein